MGLRVGLVGATGRVGSLITKILVEKPFPVAEIRFFASHRSAGSRPSYAGRPVLVVDLQAAPDRDRHRLVLCRCLRGARACTSVRHWGRGGDRQLERLRADPDVPLVVSEIDGHLLSGGHSRIISTPNCTSMIAMPWRKALHHYAGLRRLAISTYQAVSGMGRHGKDELLTPTSELRAKEPRRLVCDGTLASRLRSMVFARPIALNVLPCAGTLLGDGSSETTEERKLRHETRKILDLSQLPVSATCARVPVLTGHSMVINAEFAEPITPGEAERLLARATGVELADIPTPRRAAGIDMTTVERVRRDEGIPDSGGLSQWRQLVKRSRAECGPAGGAPPRAGHAPGQETRCP